MERKPQIHITKQFSFEAAHMLWRHDGLCKNIHGHSYQLLVTITGKIIDDIKNPKHGMVMDFSELKKIVNELIIKPFDHSLMVYEKVPLFNSEEFTDQLGSIILLPYQPTCENLLVDFAARIKSKLPKNLALKCLRLQETPTSYAEWHASDNPD